MNVKNYANFCNTVLIDSDKIKRKTEMIAAHVILIL